MSATHVPRWLSQRSTSADSRHNKTQDQVRFFLQSYGSSINPHPTAYRKFQRVESPNKTSIIVRLIQKAD